MTNRYRFDESSTQHLLKEINFIKRKLPNSFVARLEANFEFLSQSKFLNADVVVQNAFFAQRPETKSNDLVLDFTFVWAKYGGDVELQLFKSNERLEVVEVKTQGAASIHHRPMSEKAYSSNTLILGQVDHFGDPEVLFARRVGELFAGTQLYLEACPT